MKFFCLLAEELACGNAVVAATVIETKGSTPRETGAKMLIRADGEIFDTVGGGAGEAKVIAAAETVLQTGAKQIVEIDLTNQTADGVCGGTMRVLLARWHGEESLTLVREILNRLETGKFVKFAVPLNNEQAAFLPSDDAPELENIFVEFLQPPPILLIIGAGHVAVELAKIAGLLDFEIVVQDDRAEWANQTQFPNAAQILNEPVALAVTKLKNHAEIYAALLTRGYEHDLAALKILLVRQPPVRYLGMIGSRKRVNQVFREIENSGIEKSRLSQIHAPIGLNIGALTPPEIAVSIAAEIISIRRGAKSC